MSMPLGSVMDSDVKIASDIKFVYEKVNSKVISRFPL